MLLKYFKIRRKEKVLGVVLCSTLGSIQTVNNKNQKLQEPRETQKVKNP